MKNPHFPRRRYCRIVFSKDITILAIKELLDGIINNFFFEEQIANVSFQTINAVKKKIWNTLPER